ncbi:MAG: laccase domain-containing protein [Anaerolineae bacterium]|nr:laccase domain-containing protein [Anaerolineae bacterium]
MVDAFKQSFPQAERYFSPGRESEKRQLDLAGFAAWRLTSVGVVQVDDLEICTLAAPGKIFQLSRQPTTRRYGLRP